MGDKREGKGREMKRGEKGRKKKVHYIADDTYGLFDI